jgi:type IV secretory pathway VirB4 component
METHRIETIYDDIKALKLPPSFAEAHFKIREDIGDNIFFLSNGDLGVVYEIPGIYDEPLGLDELCSDISVYFKFLRQILTGVPLASNKGNVVVQITCSQRPVYSPPDKINEVGKKVVHSQREIGKILDEEEKKIFQAGLIKRKFFISIRYEVQKKSKSILKDLSSIKEIFFDNEKVKNKFKLEIERNKKEFIKSLEPLETEIADIKTIKRINRKELFEYYHDVLHAGNSGNLLFCDSEKNLEKSIYNPIIEETNEKGKGIVCNIGNKKHEINVFAVSQFPDERGFVYGLLRNFIDNIPVDKWDMVLCLSHGEVKTNMKILGQMMWFANSKKDEAKYIALKKYSDDLGQMNPACKASLRLITYDIKEDEITVMQSRSLDYLGARLVQEDQIATHMIATSLPLNCSSYANVPQGRYQSTILDRAMGFAPLFDGPQSNHGVQWFASRAGTPTRCDLFAGEGNRLTTILGTTRAGKSCLTSILIMMFLEKFPNGVVRIIDKKCSYEKLCDLFEGKVIQFSYEHLEKSPYSPFSLKEWGREDIDVILSIIKTVIALTNQNKEFTAIHNEILEQGVIATFNSYHKNLESYKSRGDKSEPPPLHPIWTDFHPYIASAAEKKGASNKPEIMKAKDEIIQWSASLEGQYGFIFSKHEKRENQTSDAKILAYDLDGLPDEQTELICSQIAFSKIQRDFFQLGRNIPKLFICDEFGMFLKAKTPQSEKINKEFVSGMAQTAAKLNVQMITLTNAVSDYGVNVIGRIIWDLASQRIFLPHSTAMVKSLKEVFQNQFTDADYDIIASLRKSNELKQSQCYIMADTDQVQYKGSLSLPLTPRMDAILTTSGSQSHLYKKLRAEGKTAWESIYFMAENHPYGDGLARDNAEIEKEKFIEQQEKIKAES